MNDDEAFKRAMAAALRFLSYRPRSAAEVRSRLRRRFPHSLAERVIESLAEQSLVDDSKFARMWRDSRDSTNPRSAMAIRRELLSKGVSRDIADEATREVDDRDSAYRAGIKHARRLEEADFRTFRRRLWGYLMRRGFSGSLVRDTVARLWDERSDAHARRHDGPLDSSVATRAGVQEPELHP
ncbi:MAG: regulatory protein RecX [Chloroflexi bacterium]|nr:regulatory protein RecX [Chloroflexota bacterium]